MMHARTRRSEHTSRSARRARALAWSAGLAVALAAPAVGVAPAAAQTGASSRIGGDGLGKRPGSWSPLTAPAASQRRGAARSTLAASTPCEDDPAFLWTTVPVPLDRPHPDGRKVNLHVEVFPHTGPQTGGSPAPARLRRLATVAAWTMMDSVQHNFFIQGDSVALRGGTVHFEQIEGGVQWTLGDARFTGDVAVSGPVTAMGPDFDAQLVVNGPAGESRPVHISGQFLVEGEDMSVVFDVGDEPATFRVPAY
jgi:hypothetical protein